MNPYPFFTLNHLTVPVTLSAVIGWKTRVKLLNGGHKGWLEGWRVESPPPPPEEKRWKRTKSNYLPMTFLAGAVVESALGVPLAAFSAAVIIIFGLDVRCQGVTDGDLVAFIRGSAALLFSLLSPLSVCLLLPFSSTALPSAQPLSFLSFVCTYPLEAAQATGKILLSNTSLLQCRRVCEWMEFARGE